MTETPDRWVILKIESPEHGAKYKVLAGWYGGYCGSDSWKLSSGTISVVVDKNGYYLLKQVSGTVYRLNLTGCGFTNLTGSILDSFKEANCTITQITLEELQKIIP